MTVTHRKRTANDAEKDIGKKDQTVADANPSTKKTRWAHPHRPVASSYLGWHYSLI
jgi:hypothetical protein